MFKFIRVDMSTGQIEIAEVPQEYRGMGGRGLTSAVVAGEVPPLCSPLGPDNKLVFAPGLLGGTSAANSGRISVGGKSPLTGGIKEANSGGQAGAHLAKLGICGLVIEGQAAPGKCYKLMVSKDSATLDEVSDLAGLGNYDTVAKLVQAHGDKCSYVSIGQAGEMKLGSASVAFTDRELRPTRHAGRGGLGAIMGAKGLKAMVIDPEGGQSAPLADKEAFKAAAKRFATAIQEHPVTSGGLPEYGTNVLTNILNEAGGLPTRNFSSGTFEGAESISGEKLNELTQQRGGTVAHGCMAGCIIRCSGIYNDADGNYVSKWPEYETVWAWGANCGIDDLDYIARYDYLCDDYGLDTIETGNAMAVAMEGGLLEFGDKQAALQILEHVGRRDPMGRLLGSGAEAMGKVYGVRRIPVVKHQSMPAYDPRAVKGIGVTYATSPMGADHTAGYAVTANVLSVGGTVDPLDKAGQVELSKGLQAATAAIDAVGLCLFVAFPVLDIPDAFAAIVDMVNAKFGLKMTGDDVGALGAEILETEVDFNRRAGFTELDDRLPRWMETESLPPHNTVWDLSGEELDNTLKF